MSDLSNYKENKITESNKNEKLEKIKKSLTEKEQNLLAELGIKQIKSVKDPSKLSLRERLALRVSKGGVGLNSNIKNENKTPVKLDMKNNNMDEELDIKEVEELLDNDFLGKKMKSGNKNNTSDKKNGKASTKKKKIIEDSEDLNDEDFKL